MPIVLGCIADDFTGATDLANTLVRGGMRTVQAIGVPAAGFDVGDAEAVVVALKSRTAPVDAAVAQSLEALRWLEAHDARQILFKYCSTFDSTPAGNIGPVADALMEALGATFAIVCPAFPGAGRTIYRGHLFVGDQLLSDSSMRNHPLTPMTNSNLVGLMSAQSKKRVGLVPYATVEQGSGETQAAMDRLAQSGISYAVVDVLSDRHLLTIGEAVAGHALITGGSGVALGLPENFRRAGLLGAHAEAFVPKVEGRAVVLAGSCSAATRAQIEHAKAFWPSLKLEAERIAYGAPVAREIIDWALSQPADTPVLIYSSAEPEEVAATQQRYGREEAGAMIEETLGMIATGLVAGGARRLIVAGGETAGAVVSALGVTALKIGREIDPGVPWTESLGKPRLALALKSGNFGGVDFFAKAFGMLS
jgi:uncharacterized protein YgbK (DUF1537 family)